jgi:anti-sigma factor RsiW
MKCSDLERYLEAYLDLRLGRSRGAILRRHLSGCPSCRARVEHLRQFERDLQRSFRAMDRVQSVWTGLEPDLVRTGGLAEPAPPLPFLLPPQSARALPQPSGAAAARHLPAVGQPHVEAVVTTRRRAVLSRWSRRVAGLVLIAAAVGATLTMGRDWFLDEWSATTSRAYAAFRRGDDRLDFVTDDVVRLEAWMSAHLGQPVILPPPPDGFALEGGRVEMLSAGPLGAIVYTQNEEPTIIYVAPREAGERAAPATSHHDGVSQLRWETPDFSYAVLSPLPADELLAFAGAS